MDPGCAEIREVLDNNKGTLQKQEGASLNRKGPWHPITLHYFPRAQGTPLQRSPDWDHTSFFTESVSLKLRFLVIYKGVRYRLKVYCCVSKER